MAAWNEAPAAGGLGECAALVRSAEALRFSAPELAVQLARRALVVGAAESAESTDIGQARSLSMRAQAVLAFGLVRVSQYVDAVEPAFAALALAEGEGMADVAMSIRLDLAACAREVGEPLLGCGLLRPVLETDQPQPSVRAIALGRLVGCIAHVGRRDDLEDALTEADRILSADDGLGPDARRMERARLSVRAAAYHRWYGDTEDAAEAAREGLTQLNRLRGGRAETERLRAQLVLELACALLDEGSLEEAASVSEAVLAAPVRATSAAAVGQLMLAVSTRVHLPAGRVDRGRALLDQAVLVADRHGLDGLLADALTVVSQLDENAGHPLEALESLRAARAAEQRRLHAIAQACRHMLTEAGAIDWSPRAANALLRQVVRTAGETLPTASRTGAADLTVADHQPYDRPAPAHAEPAGTHAEQPAAHAEPAGEAPAASAAERLSVQADTDEATGLLTKEGLIRRLRSVRNGERPVALTLVRLENEAGAGAFAGSGTPPAYPADDELSELAGRVRDIAPDGAELARSGGAELAVLLPHTTHDQAERFAAAIESAWLGRSNGHGISTGVVQSNPDAPAVDARALINAARHALTPAAPAQGSALPNPPHGAEEPEPLDDAGDTVRIDRSIINALSIPTGSGGRRRATDDPEPPPTTEADAAGPDPRPSADPGGPPGDFRTSTYEETKADLALLMSALDAESPHDAPPPEGRPAGHPHDQPGSTNTADSSRHPGPHPAGPEHTEWPGATSATDADAPRTADTGSTSGSPSAAESHADGAHGSFDFPPLQAPTRAAEDHTRNGTTRPVLSIPTPPEPDDVPEPPRRPDIPDPDQPEPIPPAPPEPGPPEPDEPGPLTPPSAGDPGTGLDRTGDTDGLAAVFGGRAGKRTRRTGGLSAAFRIETDLQPDDTGNDPASTTADSPAGTTGSAGTANPSGTGAGRATTTTGPAAPGTTAAAPPTGASTSGADTTDPGTTATPDTAGASGTGTAPGQAAAPDASGADGTDVGIAPAPNGIAPAASPTGAFGAAAPGRAAPDADELLARRERRAERSSESTTIAGLLAEALAAYQETSDEPAAGSEPAGRPEPTRTSRDGDFGRLFDWRYQSPASGRHRSPE